MEHYGPETYGERVADVYDDWVHIPDDPSESVLLAELAAGGRALELGIGTGRVALPLSAAGVEVHGIDASPAMLERLRAKPGGAAIPVTIGDMSDVAVDGEFSLVYVVFNTFFMLTTEEAQRRCFREVARRLRPGGCFLVGVFVPDGSRLERGQDLTVKEAGVDLVRLDATVYDAPRQLVRTTQVRITEGGIRLVHARLRFAYPSELDEMARRAGLGLESRWGDFGRAPFTDSSPYHVTVYRKPAT